MRFKVCLIALIYMITTLPLPAIAESVGFDDDISLEWLLGPNPGSKKKDKNKKDNAKKSDKENTKKDDDLDLDMDDDSEKEAKPQKKTADKPTSETKTQNSSTLEPITKEKTHAPRKANQNKPDPRYAHLDFLTKVRQGLPFTQEELENWIVTSGDINTCYENGQTMLLYILTRYKNPAAVATLIENGADLQTHCTPRYETLFIAAINNPSAEVMDTLLNNGANIVERDTERNTALMLAAAYNPSPKVLNTIMDYGVKINTVNVFGYNALMLAAYENGRTKILQTLLDNEMDVNFRDPQGRTPLMAAAIKGRDKAMKYLISRGADFKAVDKNGVSVLDYYRKRQYLTTLDYSDEEANTPSEHLYREFEFISEKHHFYNNQLKSGIYQPEAATIISDALKNLADVDSLDENECPPLINAAQNGNDISVFQELLNYKANPNTSCQGGKTALMNIAALATNEKNIDAEIEKVNLLLKNGADINAQDENGNTALMYAVGNKADNKFILNLIKQKADINHTNLAKESPLWLAVIRQDIPDTLKLLIEYGADTNQPDSHNETPLWYLLRTNGNKETTVVLLRGQTNVDMPNVAGDLPLWYAFYHQAPLEVIEHIAQKQTDLNVKNITGDTPLLYAVKKEYPASLIKTLIDHGANPEIVDNDGLNIYDILKNNQFFDETIQKVNRARVLEEW